VVFVGYSPSDWDFVRLYKALRADMGEFAPAAYLVSPYPVTRNDFGLKVLKTSGMGFLQQLKGALIGHCFLPDLVYDRAS
jgi:hypothetical protein